MKRALHRVAIVAVALGLAVAPTTAASAGPPPAVAAIAPLSVEDFEFESFHADYYLDVDDEGRSTLRTVETLVALFPDFDQNHGVLRHLIEDYQGEPTDLQVESVVDENGDDRYYQVSSEDGVTTLQLGSENSYVHGRQVYVITYTQHNVTRYFPDTNDDELYWDTNGTDWPQYFGRVSGAVHVPEALAGALNGQVACYRGGYGSTQACTLEQATENGGVVFRFDEPDIFPYQNVTFAIGFVPHTFVERDSSYFSTPLGFLQVGSLAIGLIGLITAIVARTGKLADGRGRPTIIAEYTPPAGVSPLFASVILKRTNKGAAAQIVDFAVNRRIRIIENPDTGWLSSTTYTLQLLDARGLEGPELNLAQALFGHSLVPGTSYTITSRDSTLSEKVRAVIASSTANATLYGVRKRGTLGSAVGPILLSILGATGAIGFGIVMLDNAFAGLIPLVLFLPAAVFAFIVFALTARKPLTDKGAELRDHLEGLREYIRLAEADRLRVLQSPQGAESTPVSTNDPREVLKLNEKLLPYSVLFGLEKEWAEELSKYYIEEPPDWYSGSTAFNAAVFSSSIGSISSSASSSMSGSSSSSGGSGGGGSSGGGGGGGGGGGF
jgi:uncharacterized membrane protein YgcG